MNGINLKASLVGTLPEKTLKIAWIGAAKTQVMTTKLGLASKLVCDNVMNLNGVQLCYVILATNAFS